MKNQNYGRHLYGFILLFLAKNPTYGSDIINQMAKNMPYSFSDSPAVYRTLNELEKESAVTSYWNTEEKGSPKKYYSITEKGLTYLAECKNDIEKRLKNLEFFLSEYSNLTEKRSD